MTEPIRNTSASERSKRLRGSYRSYARLPGARTVGPVDPNDLIQIILTLRRRTTKREQSADDLQAQVEEISNQLPSDRVYLTHEEVL